MGEVVSTARTYMNKRDKIAREIETRRAFAKAREHLGRTLLTPEEVAAVRAQLEASRMTPGRWKAYRRGAVPQPKQLTRKEFVARHINRGRLSGKG